ncbi:MAG: 3-mercaptopyruvate sulfurtransferase [Pseudomonadota bacterium]
MTLVTPDWLADRLGKVTVLDATWFMPDAGRDAAAEFLDAHIPGAIRFDIDAVADQQSPLPHTLPSPDEFARMVGAMGISNDSEVVVYEAAAPFTAPRVWWMFRMMGHPVKILDGGLKAWREAGHPVEEGPERTPSPATFHARYEAAHFADADTVADALTGAATVVDARSADRFYGEVPEPRPGIRPGHMPGALNLHYASLAGDDGHLLSRDALRTVFENAGVDLQKPVVTTCGSGVTAGILALALDELGTPARVYDGSWTEWGGDPARPVTKEKASSSEH